jgi:hypothetical protein
MRYILAAAALALASTLGGHAALAFDEQTVGAEAGNGQAAPVLELPAPPAATPDTGKGFSTPELHLGQTPGTEVRIPGLGTVGVLPKLDFGLELLYGANENKGPIQDKADPDDVQLRGTIKHRF